MLKNETLETLNILIVSIVYLCNMNLRDTILMSAFDLFLKYGIKSVSMDDICKKIGISKKTVYNVISTKDELIHKVLDKHLSRDEEEVTAILTGSGNAIDGMVNISRHVIQFLKRMTPSLIHDLKKYHPGAWKIIEERHFPFIEKTIYDNIRQGQKEGLYRKDLDANILSKLYVLQSLAISDQEHFGQDAYTKTDLYKEMIKYHLHGIISDEGRKLITQQHKNFLSV